MTDVDFKEEYPALALHVSLEKWSDMSLEERIATYQNIYTSFAWGATQPERMVPEQKEKLIDALLSGKYKQGQNRLLTVEDDGDHFCCLGVGCDLIAPNNWSDPFEDESSVYGYFKAKTFRIDEFQGTGTLPLPAQGRLGLDETGTFMVIAEKDSDGNLFSEDVDDAIQFFGLERMSLAQLNDAGFTFKQIADVIRYFL